MPSPTQSLAAWPALLLRRTLQLLGVLCVLIAPALTHAADDAGAIRQLIARTYDKPDSKVVTDPIALAGDHAVADWLQGDMGGRALLRRTAGQWQIVLCSGDALKSAKVLQESGVPASQARQLAERLAALERGLPHAVIARFDSFGRSDDAQHGPLHHSPAASSGH